MKDQKFETAKEVSEHLLHITAQALMARDFEAFADCFNLPQQMTTANSRIIVRNRDDLEQTFHSLCDHFESKGVTRLYRECVAALFQGPDRVEATHVSYVLKDGEDVVPPYPVFSVLERINGRWVITSSDYDLDDHDGQAQAMHAVETSDPEAMAIYQTHLDATAEALMQQDFDKMRARVDLPHRMTTETALIETTTVEGMQRNFERFARNYQTEGISEFVRTVKVARFESENEIIGTHISHQMRGSERVVPPYPNRIRLVRGADGHWRETHCANAILNNAENFKLWVRVAERPRLPDLAPILERTSDD
ncbi:hypothetical protein AB3Y40_12770 [Yoonia sp. R2331]|uniref:hypothetical protein n=1 Tax=Yoonia sp. R2331 TaxID=3237238 RepID=UPI0034E4F9EB